MQDLVITVTNVIVVLELHGDAGVEGGVQLKNVLHDYSQTCKSIILDLTYLKYLSSTTLGIFFYYHKSFEHSIIVSSPENRAIHEVLDHISIDKIIPIVPTRTEAFRKLDEVSRDFDIKKIS